MLNLVGPTLQGFSPLNQELSPEQITVQIQEKVEDLWNDIIIKKMEENSSLKLDSVYVKKCKNKEGRKWIILQDIFAFATSGRKGNTFLCEVLGDNLVAHINYIPIKPTIEHLQSLNSLISKFSKDRIVIFNKMIFKLKGIIKLLGDNESDVFDSVYVMKSPILNNRFIVQNSNGSIIFSFTQPDIIWMNNEPLEKPCEKDLQSLDRLLIIIKKIIKMRQEEVKDVLTQISQALETHDWLEYGNLHIKNKDGFISIQNKKAWETRGLQNIEGALTFSYKIGKGYIWKNGERVNNFSKNDMRIFYNLFSEDRIQKFFYSRFNYDNFLRVGSKIYADIRKIKRRISAVELMNTFEGRRSRIVALELIDELLRKAFPNKKIPLLGYEIYSDVVKEQEEISDQENSWRSLLGIRNLIKFGPNLIDDFAKRAFIGGEIHYHKNEGLQLFKKITGTFLDLETELRDHIEDYDALQEASHLITLFCEEYGCKTLERKECFIKIRKLQLPEHAYEIPIAKNTKYRFHNCGINTRDRSHNCGIWKCWNLHLKRYTYYVNVPKNIECIVFSCLHFPFYLAKLIQFEKDRNMGNLSTDFIKELLDKGISEDGYNKTVTKMQEFGEDWILKNSIVKEIPDESTQEIS